MAPDRQSVLVIDDEPSLRHMLRLVLEREGYRVEEADGGEGALAKIAAGAFDVALCDIRMPGLDGLGFLRHLRDRGLGLTVIMMSAYGSVDTAIECMKHGAYDYIAKPFKPDEVVLTLRKAEERIGLRRENVRLREQLAQQGNGRGGKIICQNAEMKALLASVQAVAPSGSSVLILGETGTGKELIARALHDQSPRSKGPFVPLNCGAMAAGVIESELFGHVRGAFTGADRENKGLFLAADGGTLFLDEIG
ncbi:MAG: sigma-54 dependent transcriptional regulator, partial [Brevundimonas sp.]|nr:sigma-54 dependent transcriptional regulator [Brevundimonas sp.]